MAARRAPHRMRCAAVALELRQGIFDHSRAYLSIPARASTPRAK
jgi:hypothetical protein